MRVLRLFAHDASAIAELLHQTPQQEVDFFHPQVGGLKCS
jgi:hypothetical protein